MAKEVFSIRESLSWGWQQVTKRLSFFVIITLAIFAVSSIAQFTSDIFSRNGIPLGWLISLLAWIAYGLLSLGLIKIALKTLDGEKAEYKDLISQTSVLVNFFLASILYSFICIVGFFLFIIPGLIWTLRFQFYSYLIVDKKMGAMEALQESGRITKGQLWHLFLFNVAAGFVVLLGLVCLLVGALVTIPQVNLAMAQVYRQLEKSAKANKEESAETQEQIEVAAA